MRQPSGWLLAIAVALFVGAVVAWVVSGPHRTVVHDRPRPGPTTVLVAPPQTPLPRDSGPKNNTQLAGKTTTRRSGSSQAPAATSRPNATSRSGSQKRRSPVKTRKAPRPKAKAPASPQSPTQPAQPANPAPAPRPPVDVTTPVAPVTVCLQPVGGLNC